MYVYCILSIAPIPVFRFLKCWAKGAYFPLLFVKTQINIRKTNLSQIGGIQQKNLSLQYTHRVLTPHSADSIINNSTITLQLRDQIWSQWIIYTDGWRQSGCIMWAMRVQSIMYKVYCTLSCLEWFPDLGLLLKFLRRSFFLQNCNCWL